MNRRKFKKLVKNPKMFFLDSSVIKKILNKTENTKYANTGKLVKTPTVSKKYTIYISSEHIFDDYAIEYLSALFLKFKNIDFKIGAYRLSNDEVLISNNLGKISICKLLIEFYGASIVKNDLLIFPVENYDIDDEFEKIIHNINVEFLKSSQNFLGLYEYYKDNPIATKQSVVKYALQAGVYNEKIINEALFILKNNYLKMSGGDLNLFFSKLYRVLGTSVHLEQIANKIASSIKIDFVGAKFIMKLAAFFLEAGDYSRALNMALYARKKQKNIWEEYSFLALTNFLYQKGIFQSAFAEQQSKLFLKLERNQYDFLNYLKSNIFCIVGNSPCELGKNQRDLIDSHPKVVRFNSAVTYEPWAKDYGCKTNVLIINPRYYETSRNMKYDLDYIIISDGNLYSSPNIADKIFDLERFANKVCFLSRKFDIELTNKIQSSPSSGLKFIDLLYKTQGVLDKRSIYGFSFIDQSYGMSTSYSNGIRGGLPTIHNWDNELKYFNSIVK